MRLKVQLTIDEENFSEEVAQFVWKACGKLRALGDQSGPGINKLLRDKEDYEAALASIRELRERLCSIDITLDDIAGMIEGYLEFKNPIQEETDGSQNED